MRWILAKEHQELLAQCAWARLLVALDFDGTLSPIVPDRDAAVMRWQTQELLRRVARAYPTVVISGRSRGDVAKRLGDAAVHSIVGNHGIEPGVDLAGFEARTREAREHLAPRLADLSGVDIEDKRYSLAVHYRKSRTKRAHLLAILKAVGAVPGPPLRAIHGKLVVNVLPGGAPTKGDAVLRLRDEIRADVALYVGDDATDEDVFALRQPGRLVTIKVGPTRKSSAIYHLRNQGEIDPLLQRLVELRAT